MQITVELTEQQQQFLKQFAERQHEGADDNLGTRKPLHIVQNKVYEEYPYSEDLVNLYNDGTEVFYVKDSVCYSPEEVVIAYYESDFKHTEFMGEDFTDYFQENGIDPGEVNIWWKVPEYKNIAYFFTLEEAKRYIKYQKHNLHEPRTYTVAPGYSNNGDYEPFWDLLMTMGTLILKFAGDEPGE